MKIRTDIVKMYKEIHGWVGIVSGLALFIAFYAGAITMFEVPLQRWASAPAALAPPPPLDRTPELIAKSLAAHPEAAKGFEIHIATNTERPARMTWKADLPGGNEDHHERETYYASLDPGGGLQVESEGPSPVAQFIDILHQQVGLPFDHEIAMPIMGAIALLYTIAIVSGLIVLLPSLVSDLFALRIGKNVKRMWLDVHNVLGLFSLPFHLIMALTSIVFAFHDQFYDAQGAAFGGAESRRRPPVSAPPPQQAYDLLAPAEVLRRVKTQAPGFEVQQIGYGIARDGSPSLRIAGADPRYGLRGPTYGLAELDPATADLRSTDYMPGFQSGWGATVTSFFALHFGSYGGTPIRWSYFLLGLAGAFLFYTGNLLWVESRRKKERKNGLPEQTRATRVLAALTVGVPLGCMAGISVTVAAAKPLGLGAEEGTHSLIYYAVFLAFTLWALVRGAPRASIELTVGCIVAMLCIPAATLFTLASHPPRVPLVDVTALVLAGSLLLVLKSSARRIKDGPRDSVWSGTRPRADKAQEQVSAAIVREPAAFNDP